MNKLTKTVTVPILLGALIGIWVLFTEQVSWYVPFIFYFVFGVIINGTIAHRYFAHNSFWVPTPVRKLFAVLVVLGGYGLPLIWIMQHRHHHVHSDDRYDVHSPNQGLWHAFFGWRTTLEKFNEYTNLSQFRKILRDPAIKFTTKHYFNIMWAWLLLLAIIDWKFLVAGYCVGVMFDHIRLGLINTVCHMPGLLGNYRNHNLTDNSQNNILLGILGFGFGWHNNHHRHANKLILTERWWEIDIEGYVGWLLGKIFQPLRRIQ